MICKIRIFSSKVTRSLLTTLAKTPPSKQYKIALRLNGCKLSFSNEVFFLCTKLRYAKDSFGSSASKGNFAKPLDVGSPRNDDLIRRYG